MEMIRQQAKDALGCFADSEVTLRDSAKMLLGVLGYESNRTRRIKSVSEFLEIAESSSSEKLTKKQRPVFNSWKKVDIVFQLTSDEIPSGSEGEDLPDGVRFDSGQKDSFLFLVVDLKNKEEGTWSRSHLANATRIVNRLFSYLPVIILYRYGSFVTLAAVHRRPHRKVQDKEVLSKVSLIKDIDINQPHRAHIDILCELRLGKLIKDGVRNFDDLHAEWEEILDIAVLNKKFYKEIFEWFKRAVAACRFLDDGDEGSAEGQTIRLITRLLFIWFLREKGLVPKDMFSEAFAAKTLKEHDADNSNYFKAVLQNLFFATLNTRIEDRTFERNKTQLNYKHKKLLRDPNAFMQRLCSVPFVNGGLFECLEEDSFDDDGNLPQVPSSILLGKAGLFPILKKYKFTVEENTPVDSEVALDPELLGRIFENLLAYYNPESREKASVRKTMGAYYTPREIVDYMVNKTLAESLSHKLPHDGKKGRLWTRDRLEYLFDYAIGSDAIEFFEEEKERRDVVKAIAELRSLDPAVGSGAFSIGLLQSLTLGLRRLDPDNQLWEEVQIEKASERVMQSFDYASNLNERDEALKEINHLFEEYRSSDFGRKLYLIQNGIFGVDIQPIACQITKLRFFVSLLIEQVPNEDEDNLGIRPLPNLEPRFIAANTLLPLEGPAQPALAPDTVKPLEDELVRNRERYFHARTLEEKRGDQEN